MTSPDVIIMVREYWKLMPFFSKGRIPDNLKSNTCARWSY